MKKNFTCDFYFFSGLDMEMAFQHHYHEVVDTIGNMFTELFKGLRDRFGKVIIMTYLILGVKLYFDFFIIFQTKFFPQGNRNG